MIVEEQILYKLNELKENSADIDSFDWNEYYKLEDIQVDIYHLIHYVCRFDHAQILERLIEIKPGWLVIRTNSVIGYHLPIEIALEYTSEKCLQVFGKLSFKNKYSVLASVNANLSKGIISEFIEQIVKSLALKHSDLLHIMHVFNEQLEIYLNNNREEIYQKMLDAILKADIYTVRTYIKDGFNLNSEDGSRIIQKIHQLRINDRRQLKMIAFLVANNVKYDASDFIKQYPLELIMEIREFIWEFLKNNINQTVVPELIFYKTRCLDDVPKDIILRIYLDLYGKDNVEENEYIVKYFRPIMNIVAIHLVSISTGKNMTQVAFPVRDTTKGLTEMSQNKVSFQVFTKEDGNIDFDNTKGTAIHELCHLASNIIYSNKAIPCKNDIDDQVLRGKYLKIVKDLAPLALAHKSTINETIRDVFSSYHTDDDRLAEIIVRVPHVLAKNGAHGLDILRTQSPELLELYESCFLLDCQKFLELNHNKLFELKIQFHGMRFNDSVEWYIIQANILAGEKRLDLALEALNTAMNKVSEEQGEMAIYIYEQISHCKDLQLKLLDPIQAEAEKLGEYNSKFISALYYAQNAISSNDILEARSRFKQAKNLISQCNIAGTENHIEPDLLAQFFLLSAATLEGLDNLSELYQVIEEINCAIEYKDQAKRLAKKIFEKHFPIETIDKIATPESMLLWYKRPATIVGMVGAAAILGGIAANNKKSISNVCKIQ